MWNGPAAPLKPTPISSSARPIASIVPPPGPRPDLGRDGAEARRPGRAVYECDAVQQEAGGEGAEQEVLERRLGPCRALAVDSREHVDRHRQQLEPEEDNDQVVAASRQHHAGGGG